MNLGSNPPVLQKDGGQARPVYGGEIRQSAIKTAYKNNREQAPPVDGGQAMPEAGKLWAKVGRTNFKKILEIFIV